MFILTLHPQTIGRGRHFLMLERLPTYYVPHDGVTFETMGDYATRWRHAIPLDTRIEGNPDLTGAHALRSLD